MAELTYILGAGASYQSIPIVKTFPSRFDEFIGSIQNSSILKPLEREYYDQFLRDIKNFGNHIKSHQSFDTYFKKLFHLDNNNTIIKAKKILNFYFLWEHFQPSRDFQDFIIPTDDLGNDLNYEKKENSFTKQSLIDKRYDALIAGLIKPIKGKIELFKKVNFISWNYDLNLFCSIKNFVNPNSPINSLIDSFSDNNNNTSWDFKNGIRIINMNGCFYSSQLDNLEMLYPNDFDVILARFLRIRNFSIEKSISNEDATRINFAWEKGLKLTENPELLEAREAIQRSDTIVVIGYTFPLYNRLVDLEYFNNEILSRKTIYIQDPNAIELEYQIKNDFLLEIRGGRVNGIEISPITNCDSFLVPSNIYKPEKES